MINLNISKIQEEIYNLICKKNNDVYFNSIPKEVNLSKGYYVAYKLENIGDGEYKNEIMLTITFVGAIDNYSLEEKAIETDKVINKAMLTNGRIIRQNVWLTNYVDNEEKTRNTVLQYYINIYK
jgi:hypothetical protein|nr:MAG TPA: hypothetical protein [Caudoviricetes sp.]